MSDDYDPAEVRRVLKAAGEDVKDKGKLSDAHKVRYREIVTGDEYADGVTSADFDGPESLPLPGMEDIEVPEGVARGLRDDDHQADDIEAERIPRGARPSASRPRLFSRGGGGGRQARPKRAARPKARKLRDRIPTGPVIERFWSEAAWSARRMPPLQRIMAAQAPMVGKVLEDASRGTFIDRGVLQYLARGEDRIEAVNAVFGPLVWTTAIIRFGGFDVEPVMGENGAPVMTPTGPLVRPVMDPETGGPAWNDQTKVMIGGLRFSLMSWLRVGQRHAEEIIARAEELDELGDQADKLIAFILSPPKPGQSFKDMQRESRERAYQFVNGEPQPGRPDTASSSATAPAPATPGAAVVLAPRGDHPYPPVPAGAAPDPRTLSFLPPDAHIASQVVPRAPMPQA